jgi:catechol 2,3-dioxygenase-like lactoylglutathione lyase family enzyme
MIEGLNHIGMSVSNLERSLTFYRELFGMEVVIHKPFEGQVHENIIGLPGARGRVALLRLGTLQLELFEFDYPLAKPGDPNRPACDHGITHFCIQVRDIHGEYERLKTAGVRFHCPPQTYQGRVIATYGRDPDGNIFELLELLHSAATTPRGPHGSR